MEKNHSTYEKGTAPLADLENPKGEMIAAYEGENHDSRRKNNRRRHIRC